MKWNLLDYSKQDSPHSTEALSNTIYSLTNCAFKGWYDRHTVMMRFDRMVCCLSAVFLLSLDFDFIAIMKAKRVEDAEVVYMKVLEVMLECLRSPVGYYLSDDSVCVTVSVGLNETK